jgi:hypothetical protein
MRTRPKLTVPYVGPRTQVEAFLVSSWSEILDVEGIGIHDNFFELGGDSLDATRLWNRLRHHLGEPGCGEAIYRVQSIAELADYLQCHFPNIVRHIPPHEEFLALDERGSPAVPSAEAHTATVEDSSQCGPFSIPRLPRDEQADDALARLDQFDDDQIEALLTRVVTEGDDVHE